MSLNLIRDMFFLNEKKFLSKFLTSALTGIADIKFIQTRPPFSNDNIIVI